jgi:hypothetical protein
MRTSAFFFCIFVVFARANVSPQLKSFLGLDYPQLRVKVYRNSLIPTRSLESGGSECKIDYTADIKNPIKCGNGIEAKFSDGCSLITDETTNLTSVNCKEKLELAVSSFEVEPDFFGVLLLGTSQLGTSRPIDVKFLKGTNVVGEARDVDLVLHENPAAYAFGETVVFLADVFLPDFGIEYFSEALANTVRNSVEYASGEPTKPKPILVTFEAPDVTGFDSVVVRQKGVLMQKLGLNVLGIFVGKTKAIPVHPNLEFGSEKPATTPTTTTATTTKPASNLRASKQLEIEEIKTKQAESKEIKTKQAESKEINSKQAESKEIKTKQAESKETKTKQAESKEIKTKQAESKQPESKQREATQQFRKPSYAALRTGKIVGVEPILPFLTVVLLFVFI